MNNLIEAIGEEIQTAIYRNDGETAEKIIAECDEWYENYVRGLSYPLDDPIFLAVYMCGYDNISWEDVQSSLEGQFRDDIEAIGSSD